MMRWYGIRLSGTCGLLTNTCANTNNMKTKTLLALVVLLVAACEPRAKTDAKYTELMQAILELHGCKTSNIYDGNKTIYVTRCAKYETISTSTPEKNQTCSITIGDPNVVMDSDSGATK